MTMTTIAICTFDDHYQCSCSTAVLYMYGWHEKKNGVQYKHIGKRMRQNSH